MKVHFIAISLSLINVHATSEEVTAGSSKNLRLGQDRRNLQTAKAVMSDVSKYISKQYKGDCDAFFSAFDTNHDQTMDQTEVELLAARLSIFALLNGLSTTKSADTSKIIYEQCGNAPCPQKFFCGGAKPDPAGARLPPLVATTVITSAEPAATSVEPEVIPAKPEVISAEPEVIPAEPEVISAKPEVISAKPEVISAEPEVISAEPEVISAEPKVTSVEPEVDSAEPEVTGSVKGDPHFVTWYGSHFSYHGACDLVFLHNEKFANGLGLDIHIRTEHMMEKAYSFVSRAALKIGNDILEVAANGAHFINGKLGVPATLGGFPVTKSIKETCRGSEDNRKCWFSLLFDVVLNNNDHILIKVASEMVHVDVVGNAKSFEGSVGVMGTFPALHHGKIARDGVTFIMNSDNFTEEWQVRDDEPMLFQEARFPQYPQSCTPAVSFPGAIRKLREDEQKRLDVQEACSHVTGPEWEFCVFDVTATGDYGMAATIYGDD